MSLEKKNHCSVPLANYIHYMAPAIATRIGGNHFAPSAQILSVAIAKQPIDPPGPKSSEPYGFGVETQLL